MDIINQPKIKQFVIEKSENPDLSQIYFWLEEYKNSPQTYKNYFRESYRLMLWCRYVSKKTLKELSKTDLHEYLEFLQNPQPKNFWCGKNGLVQQSGRKSKDWRPFTGKISASTLRLSVSILKSMFSYLVESRYLSYNPMKLIKKIDLKSHDLNIRKARVQERILQADEWQTFLKAIKGLRENSEKEIEQKNLTSFIVAMLYLLGLRVSELEQSNWNSFRETDGKWWFNVLGKGSKEAKIPVTKELLHYVQQFRIYLGLPKYPALEEEVPILYLPLKERLVRNRTIYSLLKKVGEKAAEFYPEDSVKHQKLKSISPHWLRHLAASHQDKAGLSLKTIQENMRHSSIATTQIYMHAEDDLRHSETAKHQLNLIENKPKDNNLSQKFEFSFSLRGVGLKFGAKEYITSSIENNFFKNIEVDKNISDCGSITYQAELSKDIDSKVFNKELKNLAIKEASLRCCEVEFD